MDRENPESLVPRCSLSTECPCQGYYSEIGLRLLKRPKISIKKLISIGSVVSLGGLALSVEIGNDYQITHRVVDQIKAVVRVDTVTVEAWELSDLQAELEGTFFELEGVLTQIAERTASIDEAIDELGADQDSLALVVADLARRHPVQPAVFFVIDGNIEPVDPDTLDAAGWMKLVWPWVNQEE